MGHCDVLSQVRGKSQNPKETLPLEPQADKLDATLKERRHLGPANSKRNTA